MRLAYILLIIFGGVLVLAVGGMFFVFGDDTLNVVGLSDSGKDDYFVDVGKDDFSVEEVEISVSGSGGGSSGSSGGETTLEGPVCVRALPVQYSLGDFDENFECLLYEVDGCKRVAASCSSELYNLDYEVGGLFGVRFSFVYGEEPLRVEIVENNVGPREKNIFNSEIFLDGDFEIGSFGCVVDMETVAGTCLEWS